MLPWPLISSSLVNKLGFLLAKEDLYWHPFNIFDQGPSRDGVTVVGALQRLCLVAADIL